MAPIIRSSTYARTLVGQNQEAKKAHPPRIFHLFSKLPIEIRLMIWELAIRPRSEPETHYLTLVRCPKERPPRPRVLQLKMDHLFVHETSLKSIGYDTHVPKYSWQRENRASYLWDAGLWDACHESRGALQWHMDRRGQTAVLGARCGRNDNGMFLSRSGKQCGRTFLRVNMQEDIFCLRFDEADMQATKAIDWGHLLEHLLCTPRTMEPRNIAFEFDPSWNEDMEYNFRRLTREATPRGLVARAYRAWVDEYIDVSRIWLISHKPKPWEAADPATSGGARRMSIRVLNSDLDPVIVRLPPTPPRRTIQDFVSDVVLSEWVESRRSISPRGIPTCLGALNHVASSEAAE